jgi:hypothetical protein
MIFFKKNFNQYFKITIFINFIIISTYANLDPETVREKIIQEIDTLKEAYQKKDIEMAMKIFSPNVTGEIIYRPELSSTASLAERLEAPDRREHRTFNGLRAGILKNFNNVGVIATVEDIIERRDKGKYTLKIAAKKENPRYSCSLSEFLIIDD